MNKIPEDGSQPSLVYGATLLSVVLITPDRGAAINLMPSALDYITIEDVDTN